MCVRGGDSLHVEVWCACGEWSPHIGLVCVGGIIPTQRCGVRGGNHPHIEVWRAWEESSVVCEGCWCQYMILIKFMNHYRAKRLVIHSINHLQYRRVHIVHAKLVKMRLMSSICRISVSRTIVYCFT